MSSVRQVRREIAWVAALPQFAVMGGLMFAARFFVQSLLPAAILGAAAYLACSITLERVVPRHHRRGNALTRAGEYAQAVEAYQKSYEFFSRHAWVDKLRYLTMLSTSKYAYAEMALMNIAFCYFRLGDAALSKQYCQKTLEQFPRNAMIKQALDTMEANPAKATRTK